MGKKLSAAALAALLCWGAVMLLGLFNTTRFSALPILDNPAVGFAPMAESGERAAAAKLVYLNLPWSEWEPEKGVYATDAVWEKYHFEEYRAAGKHLVLRFVCDLPGEEEHLDIPAWLYDETQDGEFYSTDYGRGYCPDYENKVFVEAHDRAIRALGDWLSRDSFCLYVELGSLGHWGEWHTKAEDGLPRMPSAATCARYVEPYLEAFTTAKLLMRRPFAPVSEYRLGLFNDMVGAPEDTAEWLDWMENGGEYHQSVLPQTLPAVPGQWQKAPVGGEFTSSIPMETMLGTDLPATLAMLEASHMSFIGPKCPKPGVDSDAAAVERVKAALGYQYRIAKMQRLGDRYTLSWVNDGAAPLYWDWPVTLCALDADGNILAETEVELVLSQLLPGKTIKTTTVLPAVEGAVGVAVAIRDPLTGVPALRLSMDCEHFSNLSVIYTKK